MNSSNLDLLTGINLDDLVASFGWQNSPLLSRLLRIFFRKPAQTFAQHVIEYDDKVGEAGIVEGGWNLTRRYDKDLRIIGADRIPESAFLALSNHPGMTDTVALFAALNRPDLRIIALDRPFLNALPHTTSHLFYVHDDPAKRMTLVRQVSAHLKKGGAILTFPAGHIESDPDVYPGAVESLKEWTDSVGVFVRMAPDAAILPVLVRSVVAKKYAHHWLLGIKKTKEEREKLATALQLLGMVIFGEKPVMVTIQIGKPIYARELGTTNTDVIHQAVLAEMRFLIEDVPPT
ncbi:MAG: 1-acyl-sn-glycerol-3-phosphate acyltransferase [Anaerolineales bacterium]|jgi:1-acyl-sn-glycerol-3-phosphate acyltransferase|nr:1-acyl-sn-glycerol-3-phosphate acyltransferase [Anaerolineales bacterium]